MSTQTQTENAYDFAPSAVQERPKLASTGVITGIGEFKTTGGGNGDYEMIDLIFKPTRGSRKIFPRLMIRNEMFSIPYFSPNLYTDYNAHPQLANVKEGKKKTLGETFQFIYRQNVMPAISVNKKTGNRYPEKVTGLMAVCGGTLEGVTAFAQLVGEKLKEVIASGREPGDFGVVELTTEEIVNLLKTFHASQPQVEQALVIKQAVDEDGNAKDQYELADWRGPFSADTHKKFVEQATKSASQSDVSKRLALGYKVD